jgi:guanylate cyclase soluble subunit beta
MKAPSFRCSETPQGNLVLHYYSDRPGLEFIVIGLVKTVASRLHKSSVECHVIKDKGQDGCDHVQFEIIESGPKEGGSGGGVIGDAAKKSSLEKHFSTASFMSPQTFCQIFPFHIVFDRQMNIIQCGNSIGRLIPQMKTRACKLTDIFGIVRPHIGLEFQAICSQIMSVFVLCTKNGILYPSQAPAKSAQHDGPGGEDAGTRFKGQMVFLKEKGFLLFLCSPSVMSLDDLYK